MSDQQRRKERPTLWQKLSRIVQALRVNFRRNVTRAAVALVAVGLLAGPAGAEPGKPKTIQAAVEFCLMIVNASRSPEAGVQAFYQADQNVRYYGTQEAVFNFMRCMNDSGYPLSEAWAR